MIVNKRLLNALIKVKNRQFLLLLLLMLFFQNNNYSQEGGDPPIHDQQPLSILPQSPEAATLGKFFNFPTVNASGLPDITIPIYNFKYKDFELPISLSYHASGIKVNDISTAVGLNWNLNAESSIFRTVNGRPDESEAGWLNWPPDSVLLDTMGDNHQNLANYYIAQHDVSADIFNFSLPGYSGTFFFRPEGDIMISADEPIKIEPDIKNFTFSGFKITDKRGNVFYFSPRETTKLDRRDQDGNIPFPFPLYSVFGTYTGWKVDSIKLLGNDWIFFEYEEYEYSFLMRESDSYNYRLPEGNNFPGENSYTFFTDSTTIISHRITNINSSDQRIKFFYDIEGVATSSVLGFVLDKIRIENLHTSEVVKEVKFSYEVYDDGENCNQRMKLTALDFLNLDIENEGNATYRFIYNDSQIHKLGDVRRDIFGYQNSNSSPHMIPYNTDWGHYIPCGFFVNFPVIADPADREVDPSNIKNGILKEIIYPTGGRIKYKFEPNSVQTNGIEVFGPGLRIKEKELLDINNELLLKKRYEYSGLISYPYTHAEGDYCAFITEFDCTDSTACNIKGYTFNSNPVREILNVYKRNVNSFFYLEVTIKSIDKDGNTGDITRESYRSFRDVNVEKPQLKKRQFFDRDWNLISVQKYDHKRTQSQHGIWLYNNSWTEYHSPTLSANYFEKLSSFSLILPKLDTIIQTTTNYYYNIKSAHQKDSIVIQQVKVFNDLKLLSKNKTNTSTNDKEIKRIKYADDYNLNYPWLNSFKKDENHAVGIPIDSRSYIERGGVRYLVDGITNQYNSYGKMTKQYNFYSDIPDSTLEWSPDVFLSPRFELENEYIYDNDNNLIELKSRSSNIAFVWGYEKQYIIAKIENLENIGEDLNDIIKLLDEFDTDLSETDRDSIININNQIRTEAPANTMITTYTYKPLVGITSITDPRGRSVFYEYDGLNRLIKIRDHEHNILEEYQYHYADPTSD